MSDYFDKTYELQLEADRDHYDLDHWETLYHVLNQAYANKYGHY
jgi:hypothetical protein